MQVYGAVLDDGIQEFLRRTFGVRKIGEIQGVPVFEGEKDIFIGGHRGLYTVAQDIDAAVMSEALLEYKSSKKVSLRISTQPPLSPGRSIHHVLPLESSFEDYEARLRIYAKKTRNQVRRAREKGFRLTIEKGDTQAPWYEVYARRIRELGSIPKDRSYFEVLAECAPASVHIICAWDGETLAGFNYALCTDSYMLLTQSGSLRKYWGEYVNDLLYDETIRYAAASGFVLLDMGASSLGDAKHNHFKEGFGGEVRFFIEPRVPNMVRYGRIVRDIVTTRIQSAFLALRGK